MSKYEDFKNTIKKKFDSEMESVYAPYVKEKYTLVTPYFTTFAGICFNLYKTQYHDLFPSYSLEDIRNIIMDKPKFMTDALIWYRAADIVDEDELMYRLKNLDGKGLKEYLNILSEYEFFNLIYDYCYEKAPFDMYDDE